MKLKTLLIIGLMLSTLLLSGCSNNNINKTSELCSIMKNSIKDNNSEVFIDGNICVIGDKDWEKIRLVNCVTSKHDELDLFGIADRSMIITVLFRYNNQTNISQIDEFEKQCNKQI